MDRTRYQLIRSLFHEASALPEAERRSLLAGADATVRAAVQDLLDDPGDHDSTASWQEEAGRAAIEALDAPPERVGPYRLLRPLGAGGMGVVHEAEQDEPRRRVAVKLLRGGQADPRALERFREEAEILGRLAHHGIAQVLQAGDDGGRPWIAMELVAGLPLDEHVARHRPDLTTRCRLLLALCDAVAHAHRHGVVHRDLKPANVLVPVGGADDPARVTEVKVLDFGIARLADREGATRYTEAGRLVGSLQAMSPEQLRGDADGVDTRSDVWALGVLAYEVLGGRPPHDLSGRALPEVVRRVCEEDPAPLGRLHRELRGDLEAVVAKALEREPARRYDGAAGLGEDLRRVLDHEPVSARRLTLRYQLGRLARRHRALVGGAVLALFGLVGGLLAALHQAGVADTARDAAEADARIAEAVTAFMIESFELADPALGGRRDLLVRDALDVARARIDARLATRPEVLAGVLASFGRTYAAVGEPAVAEALARRAVDEAVALHGVDAPRTRRARVALAEVLQAGGRWPEAVGAWRAVAGDDPAGLQPAERLALARCLAGQGDPVASEAEWERVAAVDDPALTVDWREARAELDRLQGRFDAAVEGLATALDERRDRGDDRLVLAQAEGRLALALRDAGRHADSARACRAALETTRDVLGDDHPQTAARLSALGSAERDLGRAAEAEALQRDARERLERRLGPEHPMVGAVEGLRGLALLDLGRLDEADQALSRAVALCPAGLPVERAAWLHDRADVLAALGRRDEAAALLDASLELLLDSVGPDHPHVATTWNSQAGLLLDEGRPDAAVPLLERVHAHRLERLGSDHPETIQAAGNLGWLLHAAGRSVEALPWLRRAHADDVRVRGAEHPAAIQSGINLGLALIAAGEPLEARRVVAEVVARHEAVHGGDHPESLAMRRWLGQLAPSGP